jgi:hypothetical protein
MNCLIIHLIKNGRMNSLGECVMSKIRFSFQRYARRAGLGASVLCAALFLGAAVPGAHAQAGNLLAHAIKRALIHKISGGHNSNSFKSPLDSNKEMVVLPEPGASPLVALGGAVGLAAWWLRRPSTVKKDSQ